MKLFKDLVQWLAILVAGTVLGILPTRYWANGITGAANSNVSIGPWQTSLVIGGPEADMYTRTHVALTGLLALNRSETTYFTATRDDAGRPLLARCSYDVMGISIAARWWSITAYADDNYLIPNPSNRFSFNIRSARLEASGQFVLALGPNERPGNWLPTGRTGGFNLLLRLYDPAPKIALNPAAAQLPRITRVGVCGA